MDELKEILFIALAAESLRDERSGIIRATSETISNRAEEIRAKVTEVIAYRRNLEALYE